MTVESQKKKKDRTLPGGSVLARYAVAFCAVTTGLCLLEGLLGCFLFPGRMLDYRAFLAPPAFGLLTSLTGLVMESERVLSLWETLLRLGVQLLLIEGMVFGLNLLTGQPLTPLLAALLAAEVVGVFVFVYFILWLNERRVADAFNRKLATRQAARESRKTDE